MVRDRLQVGMTVWTSDGHKLGKVLSRQADGFTIEKGFFFRNDYLARYQYIDRFSGDSIVLSPTREQVLSSLDADAVIGPPDSAIREKIDEGLDRMNASGQERPASGGATDTGTANGDPGEEIHIALAEEQLEVNRVREEVGRVRIRKEVRTENRHLSVPVTQEEVHVEHVPADKLSTTPASGGNLFREETLSIPVYEEHAEIKKHLVVHDELVVVRVARQVNQEVDATVRKETADIQEERLPLKKRARAA